MQLPHTLIVIFNISITSGYKSHKKQGVQKVTISHFLQKYLKCIRTCTKINDNNTLTEKSKPKTVTISMCVVRINIKNLTGTSFDPHM